MHAAPVLLGTLLIGVITLVACESPEQRKDVTQTYLAHALDVLRDCNEEYTKGIPGKAILRAQCQNRALDILRPRYPFPDLLDAFQGSRMSIAEKFGRKQLSADQASVRQMTVGREQDPPRYRTMRLKCKTG